MSALIRVVDFETTGMPEVEGGASACEVGWCDLAMLDDGSTRIAMEADGIGSRLCNPGRPMPPEACAVHHIKDVDLAGKPSPDDVLADLFAYPVDYYAAHNADFERKFCEAPKPWICTYKAALRIWPEASHHGNQFLRYFLPLDLGNEALGMPPHRAGPDAYVTAHLLAKEIKSGKASIDDMVRWSNGPALLPRVNFGKHKGAKWDDVPTDYLQWIVDKSDMDRDINANAKHWLKMRAA
jgi:exodeoxyribonuclease X